jgi:hypothetical protein
MSPRQRFPRLNEHYDVKHVRDDLHRGGSTDDAVYRLAAAQGRILVTENWSDFVDLVGTRDDAGVIGVPPHWQPSQVDSKLTALLRKHSPGYFTVGCVGSMSRRRRRQRDLAGKPLRLIVRCVGKTYRCPALLKEA